MTRAECKIVRAVLERIKDPDAKVKEAIACVEKQLQNYEGRRGQLREQYETDYPRF